jgi:hypothetical protein
MACAWLPDEPALWLAYQKRFATCPASPPTLTASSPGVAPRASQADASAFLGTLRHEHRSAFLSVRALIVSLGPEVVEQVSGSEVSYCRRERLFLRVRAAKSHLTLVFPEGVHLPDPHGRLLRRGDEWYVPLDTPENLDGHVQEFVRRAYVAAR